MRRGGNEAETASVGAARYTGGANSVRRRRLDGMRVSEMVGRWVGGGSAVGWGARRVYRVVSMKAQQQSGL